MLTWNRQRDGGLTEARKRSRCRCMALRLCALLLGLMTVMVSQGCTPWYFHPTTLETPDGRVAYKLLAQHVSMDTYRTTLTRRQDGRSISCSLDGKAQAMALSPKGDMLAVGLCGELGGASHRVIMLQSDTLRILKQIPIIMPEVVTDPNGHVEDIQRFDCIAMSSDSKTLATYFWKYTRRGGYESIIALWDTETGGLLREMIMPKLGTPPPVGHVRGEEVTSMVFSPDGSLLGVSGGWPIKGEDVESPDGFIKVWRIADGKDVAMLRPKGHMFVWNLCFDGGARHVAAWGWVGRGTQRSAAAFIWSLPEGKKVAEKVFPGRVRSISWTHEREAFEIHTAKEGTTYLRGTLGSGPLLSKTIVV